MSSRLALIGAVGIAVATTACTTGDSALPPAPAATSEATTTGPTSTVSALPAVGFDPCVAISDAVFLQFGFDPGRKERNDSSIGDEDIVACNIMNGERGVGFIAQNTPWDDIPLSVPAEPMDVNGREALYVPNAITDDSCALLMRTNFGAVIVDTFPRRGGDYGADPNMHACDGIVDMAEAIEPLIEDGN